VSLITTLADWENSTMATVEPVLLRVSMKA
jgi:hypothetical protein